MGCYSTGNGSAGVGDGLASILSTNLVSISNNTAEICLSACKTAGFFFAGLSGTACSCGNKLAGDTQSCGTASGCVSRLKPASECNVTCPGNSSQKCGGGSGSWRLSIHALFKLVYFGCYNDGYSSGLFTTVPTFMSPSSEATVEKCMMLCSNQGYTYAGITQGQYCECGNTISSSQLLPVSTTAGSSPF